jgi:selenophosphate synthetase-related protein
MKNKTLEEITESLKKRGMSESAIGKFINSIKIAIKKKQLDKLTNDPEYQRILKKYKIEPVPYDKNFSLGDLPAFRKK